MADDCKPQLRINWSTGQAKVVFPAGWKELKPLMQMDVLKDMIYDMENEYKAASERLRVDFERQRKAAERKS